MHNSSPTKALKDWLKRAYLHFRLSPLRHLPRYVKGGLRIGRDVSIQSDVKIDCSHYWHVSIGNEVTIAPEVRIIAHDASTKRYLGYTRIGKIDIGDGVFIGAASILLPGASIGENSIIGAGSVVVSKIPSNVVAAGNPARVICSLESFLEKRRKEMTTTPCFGEEYALRNHVPLQMRVGMNAKMREGIGYIK
jgi:maltose O-acetyltransferase